MGTLAGTCEIVEVEEEFNMKEKVKRHHMGRQGRVYSVGDDINQLFDSVNIKSAMKGKALQKHLMKQPIRVTSPQPMGTEISEAVNLKQALRGLCISQASEMAAMKKRSLKSAGPSGISNMGTMSRLPKTALVETKGSNLSPSEGKKDLLEISFPGKVFANLSETTPDSDKLSAVSSSNQTPVAKTEMVKVPSEDKILPLTSDLVSWLSKAERVQKRNLKFKESLHGTHTIKTVLEVDDLGLSKEGKDPTDTHTLSKKPCPSSGDEIIKNARSISPSLIKPIFWSRNIGRRKAKLESISASCESNAVKGIVDFDSSSKPLTGKLVNTTTCTKDGSKGHGSTPAFSSEKAQTELVASVEVTGGSNDCSSCAVHKPIARSKSTEKGEFSQSSKSSIGEYSSTSEESSASGSSRCCNRPHMSKDTRWEAVHCVQKQHGSLSLRHFKLLRRLGSGDIGTVYLAELVGSNCLFALKVMDNEFLAKRKKMLRAQTEREILQMLDHPFLPTLYAHFTTDKLTCLVMEYCPGGDLHVIRQKQQSRCFSEQASRFYVAEVLLAMEYLHMLGIVYRDLKPENILVREDGHIMLTDFDLSLRCVVNPTLLRFSSPIADPMKKISSSSCSESSCITPLCLQPSWQVSCFTPRLLTTSSSKLKSDQAVQLTPLPQLVAEPTDAHSNSFVGTHEYLAPEIVKGQGHGSAVDWWTYGIFLYELLYGKTPFKGSSNEETLASIVSEPLKFPETPLVSFHAKDLIIGLLMKQPENRLGFVRGASEIKQHPFFEGLNWALIRCAVPPERPRFCDVGKVKSSSMNSNNGKFLGLDRSEHIAFELF